MSGAHDKSTVYPDAQETSKALKSLIINIAKESINIFC